MSLVFPPKASADNLDYKFDFSSWLEAGDTISTASVTASPSGLAITFVSHDSTSVNFWIGAGTAGTFYTVSCTITTSLAQTVDRTATIYVTA